MSGLISKENRRIDPVVDFSTKRQEKLKKLKRRWMDDSFWHKLKRGPLASTLYAMVTYPCVFFNHHISKRSRHPLLTVYQETAIRTIKRTLNSSLSAIRNNSALMESPLKVLRCSEPTEPVNIAGVKGCWLGPKTWKGMTPQAVLLYIHGGGYVSPSLSGIQSLCYLLETLRKKHDKHVRALTIDYALAPENPYPGGLNSVAHAYRWLTTSGIPGSRNVFLCGASSGGTLVLALLQNLYLGITSSTLPRPLGAILISPWVDVSCKAPSYSSNSEFDILTTYFCQLAADNYLFGNGKPQKSDANDQKGQKEIVAWLEEVENVSNLDKGNAKNEEKESCEWRHEVVNVKRHSGEGPTHRKIRRNSRASRTSRSSRASRASRASRTSRSSRSSQNPQITETTDTVEMTETTYEYHEGVAGAYATLTSKHTISNSVQKNVKRDSIVRFSDSLAIHIQTDLNEVINTRRESWMRKDIEPRREPVTAADFRASTHSLRSLSSITSSGLYTTKEKKKITLGTYNKDPFLNPMISPLYAPPRLLAKFPPLFVSYGGREIFKDDIEMFCQKCVKSKNSSRRNGNRRNLGIFVDEAIETHPDVVIELDKDMVHSYPMLLGIFGEHSKKALIKIAAFLNAHIPDPSRPPPILRANSILSNPSIHTDAPRSPRDLTPLTSPKQPTRNHVGNKRRQKLKRRSTQTSSANALKTKNRLSITSVMKPAEAENIPVTKIVDAENIVPTVHATKVAGVEDRKPIVPVTKPAVKDIVPKPTTGSTINVPTPPIQSIEFSSSTLSEQTMMFPVISSPSSSLQSSRNKHPKNVIHRRNSNLSTHSTESVQTQKSNQSKMSRRSVASRTSIFSTNSARVSMLLYKDAEREVIPNSRRLTFMSAKEQQENGVVSY